MTDSETVLAGQPVRIEGLPGVGFVHGHPWLAENGLHCVVVSFPLNIFASEAPDLSFFAWPINELERVTLWADADGWYAEDEEDDA